MRIAVVTGAGSRVGSAFAQALGASGRVDAVWAVAGHGAALMPLKARARVPLRCMTLDIARPEGVRELARHLASFAPEVRYLVHAAGLEPCPDSLSASQAEARRIQLDCDALTALVAAAMPHMARGSQLLLMVSGAPGWGCAPVNTFGARKAFVTRYGKALRQALEPGGMGVTVTCPCASGVTADWQPGSREAEALAARVLARLPAR